MAGSYVDEDEAAVAVWEALSRDGYLPTICQRGEGADSLPYVRIERLAPSRVENAETTARDALAGSGFEIAWQVECDYRCATDHTPCELCSRPRECVAVVFDPDEYEFAK